MSHRPKQIASLLQRLISEILLKEMSDPRLSGLVSITHVKVSPDLHDAYVYLSVMPASHSKRVLAALSHAGGHIQSLVRKSSSLGTVPRLSFRIDDTLKKQAEIFEAIQRGLAREPDRSSDEVEHTAAGDNEAEQAPEGFEAQDPVSFDSPPEDRDS